MKYYVIYDHPKDYPSHFVVRYFILDNEGKITSGQAVYLEPSLERARDWIPKNYTCVPADKNDDPVIVETWL